MRAQCATTCLSALLLTACAGDGDGLDENGRPIGEPEEVLVPEFSSIQSNVLTPICTRCHTGSAAPLGLRLDEGAAFAMLVDVPSVEVPSLMRVAPGDPDASYLIQKIEGTAAVGGRMPLNLPPLPPETIAVIRQWIVEGAQPPASATIQKAELNAPTVEALWPLHGSALREPPREIVLSSDIELDTTLLSANVVSLRRAGGDSDFANENEHSIDAAVAVRSLRPTVLSITAPASEWIADEYELRVSGTAPLALADRSARPIDGDFDGQPGGDFVLRFVLEGPR